MSNTAGVDSPRAGGWAPGWFLLLLFFGGAAGAQDWQPLGAEPLRAMPGARSENPFTRVGQLFWIQPKPRPFSVDFYESPNLVGRVPIERTRQFLVLAVTQSRDGENLYQVRFDNGQEAFVTVAAFEADLYVDPPPLTETFIESKLYLSPQAYFYSLKGIFSEDPDVLAQRIYNLGPTRILSPHGPKSPQPKPARPAPVQRGAP